MFGRQVDDHLTVGLGVHGLSNRDVRPDMVHHQTASAFLEIFDHFN